MKQIQTLTTLPVEDCILTLRGQKVLLDADLAAIYGVPTKRLNEQVKRNAGRFPKDFAFQLSAAEWAGLKSQPMIATLEAAHSEPVASNWSQFATSSKQRRGAAYRPTAFTEHGALMAANILHSKRAVEMSVFVIRAFVRAREQLAANAAVLKRLAEIDKTLLEHDSALRALWSKLQPLLAPPPDPSRPEIGFHIKEDAALSSQAKGPPLRMNDYNSSPGRGVPPGHPDGSAGASPYRGIFGRARLLPSRVGTDIATIFPTHERH